MISEVMKMSELQKKYQIGTEENRKFQEEIRENLLNFGINFLLRGEVPIIWEMTELPGRIEAVRPGSLPG